MENPATWNQATKVISDALSGSLMQQHSAIFGYSHARIIHDALEKEGLLKSAPGEGSELPALEMRKIMDATIPFAELFERSKDDRAIIVGSEVREVIGAYRRCLSKLGDLEDQLKAFLSSPQQESAEFRWIPCEQELPSIGQTVIVQGGIAYRVEDEWISQTGGASGRPIMWPVTHWAKIPDIPDPPVTAEGKDRG